MHRPRRAQKVAVGARPLLFGRLLLFSRFRFIGLGALQGARNWKRWKTPPSTRLAVGRIVTPISAASAGWPRAHLRVRAPTVRRLARKGSAASDRAETS